MVDARHVAFPAKRDRLKAFRINRAGSEAFQERTHDQYITSLGDFYSGTGQKIRPSRAGKATGKCSPAFRESVYAEVTKEQSTIKLRKVTNTAKVFKTVTVSEGADVPVGALLDLRNHLNQRFE